MGKMSDRQALQVFLKQYSLDDLAKAFLALNLWLPNIGSPIKIQYLYVVLESIHSSLETENKISTFSDFKSFCEDLFPILPSFAMLEDYVPEADWRDIKYHFRDKFYQVFYGGDLSNAYDFYYAYEILHAGFESEYNDLLSRSPMDELQLCLETQNQLLEQIDQGKGSIEGIVPGHIEVPSELFWKAACEFVESYNPEILFRPDLVPFYSRELVGDSELPSMEVFAENAYRGRNCKYFFLKKGEKYYPALPRKWLTVVYDTWGSLLRDNYKRIEERLDHKDPRVLIAAKLARFILQRTKEENVFPLVRSVKQNLKVAHDSVFTAVHVQSRVFLIHVAPPVFNEKNLHAYLKATWPKLRKSASLLKKSPPRLGLVGEGKIVEFRSAEEKRGPEAIFLIVLPNPLSDTSYTVKLPEGLEPEVLTLDQVAGIFDEIESPKELSDFVDYVAAERNTHRTPPLNSYLDRFGAFKDSHGVLVPGAIEPDYMVLDFGWGSNYRFRSLKDFWSLFPEDNFFGHPRSWSIPRDRRTRTGFILDSKTFFGYAYYQRIGETSFFINAPVHRMGLDDGMINDSIMQSLFDAIDIYPDVIGQLSFTKSHYKVQVFFCPGHLAVKENELAHVRHLVQDKDLWAMDGVRIGARDYGIRVVYDKDKMIEALKDTPDRSIQIRLLVEVLGRISSLLGEANFPNVRGALEKESGKKARFKTFAVRKRASFPEGIAVVLPEQREYKLADKEIAKVAMGLDIQPGTYSAKEGQQKLNDMRREVVKLLNDKLKAFDTKHAVPVLLEKSNALIHDAWHAEAEIKASRDHEVDYARDKRSSEHEKKFLHWYRVYRYLLEKVVCLHPSGKVRLERQHLMEILALADRLIDLYVASDFINYELYPVKVTIDRDYLVSTGDEEHDIAAMEREYGEEQARLNLGLIGSKNDTADSRLPVVEYLNELDDAFKKDFEFGLRNLVNVQQVLAHWAEYAGKPEQTHYWATADEVTSVCTKNIKDYDVSETGRILDFLTLEPDSVLLIKNDPRPADDIPIWEHNKRLTRFDIRPLIRMGDRYCWGPHSVDRTSGIWRNIPSRHRLPSDIDAPTVNTVLLKGHEDLRESLVDKIKEIVSRHTTNVRKGVYPHQFDKDIADIGDSDVLAYLEEKNVLLNIESKIIDPPHSNKDSGRMQRRIFGETKEDGSFVKGDLQFVEERGRYLKANGKQLIEKLGWRCLSAEPRVVSLFVTRIGYWWTKHPPIPTDVKFVEIRLLDDFIKNV